MSTNSDDQEISFHALNSTGCSTQKPLAMPLPDLTVTESETSSLNQSKVSQGGEKEEEDSSQRLSLSHPHTKSPPFSSPPLLAQADANESVPEELVNTDSVESSLSMDRHSEEVAHLKQVFHCGLAASSMFSNPHLPPSLSHRGRQMMTFLSTLTRTTQTHLPT